MGCTPSKSQASRVVVVAQPTTPPVANQQNQKDSSTDSSNIIEKVRPSSQKGTNEKKTSSSFQKFLGKKDHEADKNNNVDNNGISNIMTVRPLEEIATTSSKEKANSTDDRNSNRNKEIKSKIVSDKESNNNSESTVICSVNQGIDKDESLTKTQKESNEYNRETSIEDIENQQAGVNNDKRTAWSGFNAAPKAGLSTEPTSKPRKRLSDSSVENKSLEKKEKGCLKKSDLFLSCDEFRDVI